MDTFEKVITSGWLLVGIGSILVGSLFIAGGLDGLDGKLDIVTEKPGTDFNPVLGVVYMICGTAVVATGSVTSFISARKLAKGN